VAHSYHPELEDELPNLRDDLLLLLFLLLIISTIPLRHPVAPLVIDLASVDAIDSISECEDVRAIRDLVEFAIVLDLPDGDYDNTGTTAEHTETDESSEP
jgi:hypothetical protein